MIIRIFIYIVFIAQVVQAQSQVAKIDSIAPDFSFKNQFDEEVCLKDLLHDKLIVMFYTDKQGAKYKYTYMDSLNNHYNSESDTIKADSINLISIGNMVGAPSFFLFKKWIKSYYKNKIPTLLDWKSSIANDYGFEKSKANIYIVDPDGILKYRGTGTASTSEINSLYGTVDSLLIEITNKQMPNNDDILLQQTQLKQGEQ